MPWQLECGATPSKCWIFIWAPLEFCASTHIILNKKTPTYYDMKNLLFFAFEYYHAILKWKQKNIHGWPVHLPLTLIWWKVKIFSNSRKSVETVNFSLAAEAQITRKSKYFILGSRNVVTKRAMAMFQAFGQGMCDKLWLRSKGYDLQSFRHAHGRIRIIGDFLKFYKPSQPFSQKTPQDLGFRFSRQLLKTCLKSLRYSSHPTSGNPSAHTGWPQFMGTAQ